MPASIDDETFLNMMDAENFGVDLNTAFDGYDDGMNNFVDNDGFASDGDCDIDGDVPKKKGSRGCNFTVGEDETVVKAWQAVGLDPITGVEQAGATYWNRIYDQFCRNNNSGIFRSQSSVTHRWQTIQVSCTKWAACLEQVHRLNPSGANAEDKVNIAQRLYKGKPKKKGGKSGKAFALHHCWVLLEHDEKWRTRNLEMPTKSKKSSNFSSLFNDEHEDIDSNDGDSDGKRSPTPSSMPYKEKRPPGRKASKEKLKKGEESVYKESLDNMVASRKELAADRKEFKAAQWVTMKEMEERRTVAEERSVAQERSVTDERRAAADERRTAVEEQRVAIEERRIAAEEASKRLEQEQKIMLMDSSNLDEKGRAYFELVRDQILASRTIFFMGGFMGGNGGNGSSTGGGGGIIE